MDHLFKIYHLDNTSNSKSNILENNNEFECPICLEHIKQNDGIIVNTCCHTICKQCLKTYIITHIDGFILCPYKRSDVDCLNYLKSYEIKALLSENEYEKFQLRCLKQIESKLPNPFHCKTLNCIGFCNIESTSIYFHCPICNEVNCIKCNAIHKFKTCYQYKNEIENKLCEKERLEQEAALEELIKDGLIMRCPKCNIFLQKRDGQCQYLRCFYCKMDICWLTRGPRWGPGGKGDISGGCKCGVNGKKCHPDCNNCH